jgi:hypothetical protein
MATTPETQKGRDSGKSATQTTHADHSAAAANTAHGEPSPSASADQGRQQSLADILRTLPGNDSATQRTRMLSAMRALGSITTFEAMRHLDVFDPRPRIHELRHIYGYRIQTAMRAEQTESGVMHRVGVYFLSSDGGGTC